jgi:hypothetical protein
MGPLTISQTSSEPRVSDANDGESDVAGSGPEKRLSAVGH